MVERPAQHFAQIARAGGDSVTFHYEAVEDVAARSRPRASTGCRWASRSTRRPIPDRRRRVSGDADIVLCMSIHPGYSGQPFLRGRYGRIAPLRDPLPPTHPHPGRRRGRRDEHRAVREPARGSSSRAPRSSPRGPRRGPTAASCKRSREPRAGARARRARRRPCVPEADRRRGRRRATARSSARARPRRAAGTARSSRSTPPASGARRDAVRDDGAVRAPRARRRRARTRSSPPASRASSSARATRTRRRRAGSSGCAPPGVEVELVDSFEARVQNEAWRTWVVAAAGRS